MPVEIKELIIRAVAEKKSGDAAADSGSAPAVAATGQNSDAMIEACVKQVLRILQKSRER